MSTAAEEEQKNTAKCSPRRCCCRRSMTSRAAGAASALLALSSSSLAVTPSLAFALAPSAPQCKRLAIAPPLSSTSTLALSLAQARLHWRTLASSSSSSSSLSSLRTPTTTRTPTPTPTPPTKTPHAPTPLRMAVEGDFDPDSISRSIQQQSTSNSVRARFRALYKFTRPHTIRGTILASIAGTARALIDTPGAIASADWATMLPRALVGMVALLLGNAFIVGINQIYDEKIDKLNKPFLPVASGEMSKTFAWGTVLCAGIVGPLIVKHFFPPILFKLYMFGWFLGAIYSVPPIRTKRNALAAGLTIATVRGFLLNFGVYYAVRDAIGAKFIWSAKVSFIARFMTVFATVIAVTKDLPDTEGDRAYNINTFATKIGVSKIAKGASAILFLNYVGAIVTGLLTRYTTTFNLLPMIGGHVALAITLLYRFRQLDPESISSIKTYYKHIWDLFYLEYLLYVFI